jgi:hypothetical protein
LRIARGEDLLAQRRLLRGSAGFFASHWLT